MTWCGVEEGAWQARSPIVSALPFCFQCLQLREFYVALLQLEGPPAGQGGGCFHLRAGRVHTNDETPINSVSGSFFDREWS